MLPGQGQQAQGTPESTMILLPPPLEGRKLPNRPHPQKPKPLQHLPPTPSFD